MIRKNIVLLGILISVYFFMQPNFGFHPIKDVFSLGQNIVPLIIYLETIFLGRDLIKDYLNKRPILSEKLNRFAPRKILFPFYKPERHHFLMKRWWIRLLLILYILALIFGVIWIWMMNANSLWGWCYDNLPLYLNLENNFQDNTAFNEHFAYCKSLLMENLSFTVFTSIGLSILIHYFIQFIFFTIIINYVVLNGRNK